MDEIIQSIMKIHENKNITSELQFKNIEEDFDSKQTDKINTKKATYNVKLLKLAESVITKPTINLYFQICEHIASHIKIL